MALSLPQPHGEERILRVSNHAVAGGARCHPSRRAQMRAPQDEVFFFFDVFFDVFFLAAAGFFLVAAFAALAALRAFGRLPNAARCAAAKAALAQPVSSSGSSYSRSGSCQYEPTVTVLALV